MKKPKIHPTISSEALQAAPPTAPPKAPSHNFSDLIQGISKHFAEVSRINASRQLFHTTASDIDLWTFYLLALPEKLRQEHNCNACKQFIRRYGDLAWVEDDGRLTPAFWSNDIAYSNPYSAVFRRLARTVSEHRVTLPAYHTSGWLGQQRTGEWSHIAVHSSSKRFWHSQHEANVAAVHFGEARARVIAAQKRWPAATIAAAMSYLHHPSIHNATAHIAPLQWLSLLPIALTRRAWNQLSSAVETASEGYTHWGCTVLASLLDDIASNTSQAACIRNFNAHTSPLTYQRPQAAPAAGNIIASEALVQKLGLERAFARRFAQLSEALPHALWSPAPGRQTSRQTAPDYSDRPRLFSGVRSKEPALPSSYGCHTITCTWARFSSEFLPRIRKLEINVPSRGHFIALTTAQHADAPPLLAWDAETCRNPVSWYVYPSGSDASNWNLNAGWTPVSAVVPFPCNWHSAHPHYGLGAILLLEGCHDLQNSASAIFPQHLRSDLHGARATIEAFSNTNPLGRASAYWPSACGYDIRSTSPQATLRGFDGTAWTFFSIDRWN